MKIIINPNGGYVKEGKLDLYNALVKVGVNAATCVCSKNDGKLADTDYIRKHFTKENLIRRGVSTILQDHTTPSEQISISLEISGISRRLCLILNNEKEYAADELSLRYTKPIESKFNTKEEIILYYKWLDKFKNILNSDYYNYFYILNNRNEKATIKDIEAKAQENARNFLGISTLTNITYTVPLAQLNKICLMMERVINNPQNDFEKSCIEEMKEFIKELKNLDIYITKSKIYNLAIDKEGLYKEITRENIGIPNFDTFKDNEESLYANRKNIDLSLLANRNKFSSIDALSEASSFGISYTTDMSLSCLAQLNRHRTINVEMKIPTYFTPYIPLFIKDTSLEQEYIFDMNKLRNLYPLGQNVTVNIKAMYEDLFKYVATERSCMKAQNEIANLLTLKIIPFIYKEAMNRNDTYTMNLVKDYLNKYRCGFKDYECPQRNRCLIIKKDRRV